MILMIIYLLGLIASGWCIYDIFREFQDIALKEKLAISLPVLLFSWTGFFVYIYIIRVLVFRQVRRANRGQASSKKNPRR